MYLLLKDKCDMKNYQWFLYKCDAKKKLNIKQCYKLQYTVVYIECHYIYILL